MSKQLFIPTGLAAGATGTTPATKKDAMVNGSGAFFKVGSNDAISDLDTVDKNEIIQIVRKRSDGEFESSLGFRLSDIVSATKAVPSAGVVQETDIAPKLPSVQALGDVYTLKVIETTIGEERMPKKTFEVVNQGSNFTVSSLIDAFVALIGTDEDVHVTAVKSGTTKLTLKGVDSNRTFRVAIDGSLIGAAVNYRVNAIPSEGTPEQIKNLEEECLSFNGGVTNKVLFVRKPQSEVKDSSYNLYTFVLNIAGQNVDSSNPVKFEREVIYIAEKADGMGAELYKVFHTIKDIPVD